ncbi:uncharacterized protein LOC123422892 [Hordeum vulgare subsp. vulgare]|uniref:uncharacterized protein LOC123422892 n=1 Tax=Hordeum vulgare subsp. vulgare TaxID=112509 RepID=UPI001D1A4829|nr:uncharacterized protein LOC123422892 [Hordeum vulgare subsp. vulgare]
MIIYLSGIYPTPARSSPVVVFGNKVDPMLRRPLVWSKRRRLADASPPHRKCSTDCLEKRLREMVFEDSSSSEKKEDDEDFEIVLGMIFSDDISRSRTGSQFGLIHITRDRAEGYAEIMRDYFAPNPTYPVKYFCRRFRIHTRLFLSIAKVVEKYHD